MCKLLHRIYYLSSAQGEDFDDDRQEDTIEGEDIEDDEGDATVEADSDTIDTQGSDTATVADSEMKV